MNPVDERAGRIGYSVITPARDESENLRRLADSIIAQTVRPDVWVVVDNGSTDDTVGLVRELAATHSWIRATTSPGERTAVPGAPIVRAFHAGLAQLAAPSEVVVKVDADVSMAPDHFERLMAAFAEDPALGIAGSRCFELEDGAWQPANVTGSGVRGAVRAYRWACLEQLLPLPERTGWDTIDELQAATHGWKTETLEELRFDHHRRVGARDGAPSKRWLAKGEAAYYLGYSPVYLSLRAVYRARRDGDLAALAMVWGYVRSGLRRERRHPDRAARSYLRREQRLRNIRARLREADAGGR
jgi:glycosyltransferase involved in cell wall biosynthesis